MYCKYCGKQIDDDSKFCKECGKDLSSDISNSSYSFSIGTIKPYFIPICLTAIWYALTFVFIFGIYRYAYEDESPIGMLALLWITPLVYYLEYIAINKKGKYPLKFWNDTDKTKTKLFKWAYLIYTYFVPFGCCEHNRIDDYLGRMFIFWLVPSILIYLLYCFISSKSH